MATPQGLALVAPWRSRSVPETFEVAGRWLVVCAVATAMLTPRMSMGPIHLGPSDVLGVCGAGCWAVAWATARSQAALLGVAKWPLLAVIAGILSMTVSPDLWRSVKGLVELLGLWVLPSLAVAGLVTGSRWRNRVLSAASAGTLVAAVINVVAGFRMGFAGGLPQVWGAADGFQGYFQVVGMAVAFPRLGAALSGQRAWGVVGWSCALVLHAFALLLTQTRGAWLAAFAAIVVLGLAWRRAMLVALGAGIVAGLVMVLSADWAGVIRERTQSVFQPEAQVSGFDSSIIRIALALTGWNMFLAHPLTGVGLKGFALALPYYAPAGLPLAVEMGPDQVLIPIEGPHSTYLSLLSETGLIGALAIAAWVVGAWSTVYRWTRAKPVAGVRDRDFGASLLAAIAAIGVFNLFAEMNASGTLPLIVLLALGHSLATDTSRRAARV